MRQVSPSFTNSHTQSVQSQLQTYKHSRFNSAYSDRFSEAQSYPNFFEDNLVHQRRKIIEFKVNVHTHQTIFYFQLFKLIYENQDLYEKCLKKINQIISNINMQFVLPKYSDPYYVALPDFKIKKIIIEFAKFLHQTNMTVIKAIEQYPIIDRIWVILLRNLLIKGQKCQKFNEIIPIQEIYSYLSQIFEIPILYYPNCIHFPLVDVFAYFSTQDSVFMAFIQHQQSSQTQIPSSSEFYNRQEDTLNLNSVNQLISQIQIPQSNENYCEKYKNCKESNQEYCSYEYSQSLDIKMAQIENLNKNQQSINDSLLFSNLNKYMLHNTKKTQINFKNQDSIDKQNMLKKLQDQISQESSLLNKILQNYKQQKAKQLANIKRDKHARNIQKEIDITFEFTSSFVAKQLSEPHQSNVRDIKARARGRRDNLKKMINF